MTTIVTLTMNPALDISTDVERLLPGQKLRCSAARRDPGGGGINVARAINKLGGRATAVYPFGGPAGDLLKVLLDAEGTEQLPIRVRAHTRESFIVRETSSGENFRFILPGPKLNDGEWQCCLDRLLDMRPQPEYIVASGSLPGGVPMDFYARLARRAAGLHARLILDTSGEALHAALDEGVYLVRTNFHELEEFAACSLANHADQERFTRELVERGAADVVILTLGAEGALLTTRECCERVRAPQVKIVGPTGAGDSFVAAFTFMLARGRSLQEALRYGVAGSSAALLTPGTELLRRQDADDLYRRICVEPADEPCEEGAPSPPSPPADPGEGSLPSG